MPISAPYLYDRAAMAKPRSATKAGAGAKRPRGNGRLPPVAHPLQAPLTRDSIDDPIVTYGSGPASINFLLDDGGWGRVTFEKLDAIRVCRGEYEPYESSWEAGDPRYWISTVSRSPWLRERYEYEKRHYGDAYGFGGDVDEMLRDFSHYIFRFHDQFVEVLSAGIWFEADTKCIGEREPDAHHPSRDLPESAVSGRFKAHGITWQVRENPRPMDDLLRDAAFGSQKLMQFAAELDGSSSVSWTLSLRVREGRRTASLSSYFGKVEQSYDDVPSLSDLQPRIEAWLCEVQRRREEMGKGG